jgi:hypothetical protein
MELFRLHAYSVLPQRKTDDPEPSVGGAIKITPQLKTVMDSNIAEAKFSQQPLVDFEVDTESRTNETRDAVMFFAFGEPSQARSAALELALRLSMAMDRRSTPCLFVPAALRDGALHRVILWIFPREDAFQLRQDTAGPTIEILTDVFSQKSRHRKAAQFEGRYLKTEFLQGRILDHQANAVSRDFADFWMSGFLQCVLSMKDDAGTRLLAKTIRLSYDDLPEAADREQLHSAIIAVRHSPQRRVSLYTFAERYLEGEAKETFLNRVPNEHALRSSFNFDLETFDTTLQFRIFELEKGVFVSSPLAEIGATVKISGHDDERQLRCEGRIVTERMRTRHA